MFAIKLLVLACLGVAFGQNDCQTNRLNAVKRGDQGVRGVNLGSWFALEHWMSPSPWDDYGCDSGTYVGQYNLEKCLGSKAQSVMKEHWSTWITENDFAEMSTRGINAVRVPIGWWQIYDPQGGANNADLNQYIDPTDYVTGGLDYLDKAFDWGLKYGIGIIVDMHAAPGSQNGNEHSSPVAQGAKYWDQYPDNVAQTVDSIDLYAERYANHEALFGFCLLNEPDHQNISVLQDYYKRGYNAVRKHSSDAWIVISSLINPFESGTESHWTGFMNSDQGYSRVAMDLHYYSCFGGDPDQTNMDGCIGYINWDRKNQISDYIANNPKPMLIGEWSACNHAEQSRNAEFMQAEVNVYNTANLGWTFWAWAPGTSNNVWSLKSAFNAGWIENLDTAC